MRLLWLLCTVLLWSPARGAEVIRLDVDSVVHPVTVEMLGDALKMVEERKASLLLIRLDTPGGLMEASREMVEMILASPVPVVAYVSPGSARAASAGFFLLMAADVAAMAPGTRTGAASPVMMGQEVDPVMRRKIESDAGAWMRSLTTQRGRNAELAQETVTEARSFTHDEAMKANLIDLVAQDEAELLKLLDGREVKRFDGKVVKLDLGESPAVTAYAPSLRQKILKSISSPSVAFALLLLGALGLYVEFSSPGLIAPGVLGAILALLGLTGLSVMPISWLGVSLIILALALFVLEAKFASYGILATGGAISMVLGAMLLIDGPPELRIGLAPAIALVLPFAAITLFLVTLVVRAHRNVSVTGTTGMIGKTGVARTPLTPNGKVFVHGELWDATCTAEAAEGARVRVVSIEGLRLFVEPLP
ncbi:MAG: nodulation protein NfeD [Bryobacteraceae bacterium]|nr:nodulation protein NfeD [Bryobacteraceae bacterium]